MSNAFEYGDALLPETTSGGSPESDGAQSQVESNQPYLNLATYVPFCVRSIRTFPEFLSIPSIGLGW